MKTNSPLNVRLSLALVSLIGLYALPTAAEESILTATIAAPRHGQPLSSDRLALLGQSQGYKSLYDSMFGTPPTEVIRVLGSELSQFVTVFSRPMTASAIHRGQGEFAAWKNRFSTEVCQWQSSAQTGVNCQTLNQEIRFAVSQRNSFSRDLAVQKLSALSETVARLEKQKNIFGPGLGDDFLLASESYSFADVVGLSASEFRPRIPDSFYSQSQVPTPTLVTNNEENHGLVELLLASKQSHLNRAKVGQCARYVWNALSAYLGDNVRAHLGHLKASGQAIVASLRRNPQQTMARLGDAHLRVAYRPGHTGEIEIKTGDVAVFDKGTCGYNKKYGHIAALHQDQQTGAWHDTAQITEKARIECLKQAVRNRHATILAVNN